MGNSRNGKYKMPSLPNLTKLIPTKKLIELAKNCGLDFGKGDPNNRLRYYTKTGLIPHAERKLVGKNRFTQGHYPLYTLELLKKIEDLKNKETPVEKIKDLMAQEQAKYTTLSLGLKTKKPLAQRQVFYLILGLLTVFFLILTFTSSPLGQEKTKGWLEEIKGYLKRELVSLLPPQQTLIPEVAGQKFSDLIEEKPPSQPIFLASSENLIINSSFEHGLSSIDNKKSFGQAWRWGYLGYSNSGNSFVSGESVRTGTLSLTLYDTIYNNQPQNDAMNLGISQKETTTVNGRNYLLSVWVRTQDLKGNPVLRLGFMGGECEDKWQEFKFTANSLTSEVKSANTSEVFLGGDHWKEFSFLYPGTCLGKYPFIEIFDYQGGKIFVDDVSLREGTYSSTYNLSSANEGSFFGGAFSQTGMAIGDRSIIADSFSNLYPADDNLGSLGLLNNRFNNVFTQNVDIENNLKIGGGVASSLLPASDDTYDLGSNNQEWHDLYLDGTASVDGLIVHETAIIDNGLTVKNGLNLTGDLTVTGNLLPGADSTYNLGASGNEWNTIYVDTLTAGGIGISGNITMPDDSWIGLGAAKGRLEFDDQDTDELNILSANVGIGTATPGSKLEISDGTDSLQISASGDLTFVDANAGASITGPAGGNLTITGASASGGDLLLVSTTNTTKGDIQFHSDSYYINSSGQLTLATDETINGIDIASGAISDVTDLALVLGAANDFTIDAATTDNTTTTGVINLDVDSLTTGNIGFSLDYQDTNTGAAITAYASKIDVTIDANATGNDTVYGQYIGMTQNDAGATAWGMYVTGEDKNYFSGNVGIGTTTPSTALEIASSDADGGLKITQGAQVTGTAMVYIDNNVASNKPALQIDVTSGGDPTNTHGILINNSGAGYGLIVNGGNSGFGVTSPATIIDARNSTAASANGQETLRISTGYDPNTVGSGGLLSFWNTTSAQVANIRGFSFGASDVGLAFGTGYNNVQPRMMIDNVGKVGIGQVSPAAHLEVEAGSTDAVTGLLVDQDDLDQIGAQISNAANATATMLDLASNSISGDLINLDWDGATTLTGALTGMDIDLTNVTADTTNPLYGIHVNDQASATASTEYGIYVEGTNWDYGIYSADDAYIAGNLTVAGSMSYSGTSTWTLAAGGQLVVDAAATDNTTTSGVLNMDVDSLTNNNIGFSLDYQDTNTAAAITSYASKIDVTIDANATGNDTVYGQYIGMTQNDAAATAYGLYVTGEDKNYFSGNVGIGTTGPDATLDVLNSGAAQLRLTQADDTIYGTFQIDGSGNLLVGTTGSSVTFTSDDITAGGDLTVTGNDIKDSGGNTAISFDATGGIDVLGDLTAAGRRSRTLSLNAEYPGAVLTAFYGGGTDTSITGTLTSDIEANATDNQRTYYQWVSTEADLNYYTIAVRITLPQDFSAWQTSNALQVDFVTENTTNTNNALNLYVYLQSDVTTSVASSTNNASSVADTWTTVTVDDSVLDDGADTEWDAAGETAVIYLRMASKTDADNGYHVRVGDIKLNYLSKW